MASVPATNHFVLPRLAAALGLLVRATSALSSVAGVLAASFSHEQASEKRDVPIGGCAWAPPTTCASTYSYKGQTYTGCSTMDSSNGGAWCSHDGTYSGAWSVCTWTCTRVPGAGPIVMPFANDWVPTDDEVKYYQGEATRRDSLMQENLKRQQELLKQLQELGDAYNVTASQASDAKERARTVSALADEEAKRIAALPLLARMAQEQALQEHAKRLAAEGALAEAHAARAKDQSSAGSRLEQIRQDITKQRLMNRIRAAEDARIASAALEAARRAKADVQHEKEIAEKVAAAVNEKLASQRDAMASAVQEFITASANATAKVSAATAEAAQYDTKVALAKVELEHLREAAEKSAEVALRRQQEAYEDRAKADAAVLTAAMLNESKNCEEGKLNNHTTALESAKANFTNLDHLAKENSAAESMAEEAARTAQNKAVEDLKKSAGKLASVYASTQYASEIAKVAPEAFVKGFADAVTNKSS
mmetsp:Transcript_86940/g.243663  ORF Transcript_86940/g.243663 Transcript_86940/m.243663 type:complete len:480 (+) Transcript_86940:132-1571(+)